MSSKKGEVVEQPTDGQQLRVGCVCGWEVVGSADVIVPAVLEHGEKVHNMSGTPEQVLANAERVGVSEAPQEPGVGD
jgi:predicted small metal-binding protein